jgi:stage IV sporulation protein A
LNLVGELAVAKKTYDKLHLALRELEETGYGIVEPTLADMTFEEPEMVKQGRNYGVRLRARGPAIHMIKTEIETTVSPVIGTEEQGEELVSYLTLRSSKTTRRRYGLRIYSANR